MKKLELNKLILEVIKEDNWASNLVDAKKKGTLKKQLGIVEDKIPGGKGDTKNASEFDPIQLKMGIEVEKEHTDDPEKAKEIAIDHLTEDPKYYSKLKYAGLADELKLEDIKKQIRNIIKEYYDDEQATQFVDAVIDLLTTAKSALSKDMEEAAQLYYSKYFRTARSLTTTLRSATHILRKLSQLK